MKWENLKPIVVLTVICLVVSAALAGTYNLTKPVIDAAKAAQANEALAAVLPEGADFEEVTVTAENVTKAYKAGNGAGYVFQAQGKGFAGMISVMVGISADGTVTGTQVMEHGETPSIGDRIETEPNFQQQYIGKDFTLKDIEFLTGATFSSKGFNAAVGNAFVAYGELAGIEIEAPTEEKVYPEAELIAEMLGDGYTELETAPEGTDSAYQSELGYAFNVHASGFSGELHILVAIDNNGAIIASKLYQHTETPNEYEGIDGAKLSKSSYSKKWIGVTAETPDSELPMVSKATFTSNGYKEAVKLAFAAYERSVRNQMSNKLKTFTNGIIKENPVLVLVLGTCPAIATSTSVLNALGMGLAATFVLLGSNIVISLLRNIIPNKVRIPCFIVVIAGFVSVVQLLLQAYAQSLYQSLGIFLPLIVVNCIILGRAEMFASKNNVLDSALDGLGMGLGFTLALFCMATIREILGSGTWCGITLTANLFDPIAIMKLTPGGFLVYGVLIAVMNKFAKHKPKKTIDCAACGACGSGCAGCPSAEKKEGGCEA